MFRAPFKQVFVYAFLASAAAFMPAVAGAAVIAVSVSEDGGVAQNFNSGVLSIIGGATTTANFGVQFTAATQNALPSPGLLFSNTLTVNSDTASGAHFLDVIITASGLTGPLGSPLGVNSGFTQNFLSGFTTTLTTFVNGTQVGTATFNPSAVTQGTDTFGVANTGAGPYSVTEMYHIVNNSSAGTSNATIAMIGVPGPIVGAGLPGLIAACLGLFGLNRRRKKLAV